MKQRVPISLYELFYPSPRTTNFLMILLKVNFDISKQNFIFNGSSIWNSIIGDVLNKCLPNENNVMVPGSSEYSDLTASIAFVKNKLKDILFKKQKLETPGRSNEWMPNNHFGN